MGRQAEILLGVELKRGWQLDISGENYVWECSLEPRHSSYGRGQFWRLDGKRFGAPMAMHPDEGWTDAEVLCDMLSTFMALEEHESLEWFQTGGRAYIDPHGSIELSFVFRKRAIYEMLMDARGGGV